MEIPELKGMVDFDGGVYRTLSVSDNIEVSMWGPLLILALIAGIVNAVKLFAVKVGSVKSLSCSEQPLLDSDSDADTCPSEDEEEYEVDEDDDVSDFRVRGSDQWQFRNFSTGDHSFSAGADQSVVKLWDNVGSGSDGHGSGAVKSILAVGSRGAEVRVWDRRVSCGVPAILAEWRVGEVAVGDVRMVKAPLRSVRGWGGDVTVTECVFDTWDWEGESCDSLLRRRQVSPDVRFVNWH